jgi:hypothetical protein
MKPYGFKLYDGSVTFTRWFGSNGMSDGIPTGDLHRAIVAQHFLVFHQAYAYAKSASREYGFEFTTLTEADYKKLGNPVKKFFKNIFRRNSN